MVPSELIDLLIAKSFQLNFPKFAEALVYWGKGVHRQNFIRYKNKTGLTLWLNPHNYIDRIILSAKVHDGHVLDALHKNTTDSETFWDIGANIGYVGLSMLRAKTDWQVIGFEPSPFTFPQLFMNNELHGNKMTILPFALSNADKIQNISLKINRNSGQSTLFPQNKFNYDCSIPIQTKIADELVSKNIIPLPTVVKIDVEGAEFMVLLGMSKILDSPKLKIIIFEGPSKEDLDIFDLLWRKKFTKIMALNDKEQTDFIAFKDS